MPISTSVSSASLSLNTLSAIRRMSASESKCRPATAAQDFRRAAARPFFADFLVFLIGNPLANVQFSFCSVGLQADTVDAGTCPPEGGRYIDQDQGAHDFANAAPSLTLRKRAGDAPWPVPIVCMGWP